MNNVISFKLRNGMILETIQTGPDENILVCLKDFEGNTVRQDEIPPGDFVMLLNLYAYTKDNDIRNDFINPEGKNRE